jgi:S1-C subfamily serine protease
MAGRLVGINTSILTRSGGSNGIGFAIPANLVARFVEQAQAGRTQFARPWAGVSAQSVDAALAEGLGMAVPDGIIVTDLHPDSPFRAAGLARGDVILAVDDQPVTSPPEMIFRMSVEGVGRAILLDVLRDGKRRTVEVPMVLPPEEPARDRLALPQGSGLDGLTVSNINPAVQQELGLPLSAAGVVAERAEGLSARLGVQAGDVLVAVNGRAIGSTRDLVAALDGPGRSYQLELERAGRRLVLRYRL